MYGCIWCIVIVAGIGFGDTSFFHIALIPL